MPELRHLNDTLGKVLWQSRVIFLGLLGGLLGRCRVLNFQKKKKNQKSEPFKNLLPKRNPLQNSGSNRKSLKQLHFDNLFLVHLFGSNWNISHGIEIQECLKPSQSILVHQLEMHGHLWLDSPGFGLRWLLEGWAWTLFTFCNPKIGHLLGLCFQKGRSLDTSLQQTIATKCLRHQEVVNRYFHEVHWRTGANNYVFFCVGSIAIQRRKNELLIILPVCRVQLFGASLLAKLQKPITDPFSFCSFWNTQNSHCLDHNFKSGQKAKTMAQGQFSCKIFS